MTPSYDALIVGARCAGAATAMLLARAGARVLLVERDAPGADTLSTHALMRGAVMQLARWSLLDAVVAAGTPPIRATSFDYGDERIEVAIRPGDGVDALYAPRRTVLDPILVEAATAAGAEPRFHTALHGLLRDGQGRVTGAALTGPGGHLRQVRAGIVIGADGRRSTVARQVGAPVLRRGRHAAAIVYAHVANLPDRGNRWLYRPGLAVGAIPTNDGLHCVFAAMPPERFRAEIRPDPAAGLRAALARVDPGLAAGAIAGRPAAFAGEPGFWRRSHGAGWALVGDAGCFRDPITAHGITDALRDAELLAAAVVEGGEAALAEYQATRDQLSAGVFVATDAIAALPADMARLKALHIDFNRAMKPEQDWIAGRRPDPAMAAMSAGSPLSEVEAGPARSESRMRECADRNHPACFRDRNGSGASADGISRLPEWVGVRPGQSALSRPPTS